MATTLKVVFLLVVISTIALSSPVSYELQPRAEQSQMSIITVLDSMVRLLQNVLGFMSGTSSINDLVSAIQNMASVIGSMINVKAMLGNVPIFGRMLEPLVDGASKILENTPVLGGVLSEILVGG